MISAPSLLSCGALALIASVTRAQDTISIFFPTGISRLADEQLARLRPIETAYDLSRLDSVQVIGMADTVGDARSNLRLSQKRADRVRDWLADHLPETKPLSARAMGELRSSDRSRARRVDVILFEPPTDTATAALGHPVRDRSACYYVDYALLHRIHVTEVNKGRRKLALIERAVGARWPEPHYWVREEKDGTLSFPRVKWSTRITGEDWWRTARQVTEIPADAFQRYGIITIGQPPCDSCNEDLSTQRALLRIDTCLQTDRFLMENVQVKLPLFARNRIRLRAPRSLVDLRSTYYHGCHRDTVIHWYTRDRRRDAPYYYADLRSRSILWNITRVMTCCDGRKEDPECTGGSVRCGGVMLDRSLQVLLSGRYVWGSGHEVPGVGLGLQKTFTGYPRLSAHALAGVSRETAFWGEASFDVALVDFPLRTSSSWESPGARSPVRSLGSIYAGMDGTIVNGAEENNRGLVDLHVGLARISTDPSAFPVNVFIECCLGNDLRASDQEWGVFGRIGIDLLFNL